MTLVLYSVPHSLYCAKTRIMLRAKGLAWEERLPEGGATSALYRARFPFGNLPAILDGSFALSDSEAIAEYLNERHPNPPMLPANVQDRARMRERGRFHDTRLEPALRQLFALVAMPNEAAAKQAAMAIGQRLDQLARLLREPLPFGLGDCGYPPTFLWIELLAEVLSLQIDWPDAVLAYRADLETLPFVAAEMRAYRPDACDWIVEKQHLR